MAKAERVAWIDIAKGICIVAVVSMYATERVDPLPGAGNWMEYWVDFARPFRMPDFFLISGLFLARVIDRPWRTYLDKKAVHYLYFFALWTLIDFPFIVMAGKGGSTPADVLSHFIKLWYSPFAMLWFIQMLAFYFVVTRLIRGVPAWVVMTLAVLWQMFPLGTHARQLEKFGERYIYFYVGYAFAPFFFRLAETARLRRRAALLGLAAWAAVDGLLVFLGLSALPGFGVALGFLGAGAVITISSLLSETRFKGVLTYIGERSIVVYLSFLMPMTALLLGVHRFGWFADRGTLAASMTVLSVMGSLALQRLTGGTFLRFLFERPQWAMLKEAPERSEIRGRLSLEITASS